MVKTLASIVSYIQYRPDLRLSWLHFVVTPSGDKMRTFFPRQNSYVSNAVIGSQKQKKGKENK